MNNYRAIHEWNRRERGEHLPPEQQAIINHFLAEGWTLGGQANPRVNPREFRLKAYGLVDVWEFGPDIHHGDCWSLINRETGDLWVTFGPWSFDDFLKIFPPFQIVGEAIINFAWETEV